MDNNKFTERSQRFFGNAYAKYSTKFGTENQKLDVKYQLGTDAYTTNYTDLWGYGHANGKGSIDHYGYTINEVNSLLTFNYDWNINEELNLNVLAGNEFVHKTKSIMILMAATSTIQVGITSTMPQYIKHLNHIASLVP